MKRVAAVLAVLLLWPTLAGADRTSVDTAMAMALFSPAMTPAQLVKSLEPIDQETLPVLRDYLTHSIAGYRASAATALAAIGGAGEAPRLVPLLADESSKVRQAAAAALEPLATAAVESLLTRLEEPRDDVELTLVADLLSKAGPAAIVPVASALHGRAKSNSETCVHVLLAFETSQVIEECLRPGLDPSFARSADHGTLVRVFETGVALIVADGSASRPYLDQLCCALRSEVLNYPDYAEAASRRLECRLAGFDPEHAPCSPEGYASRPTTGGREATGTARRKDLLYEALAAVKRGPIPAAFAAARPEPIRRPTKDPRAPQWNPFATPTPTSVSMEQVDRLLQELRSPDANTRGNAAEALGKAGDSRAVEPLLRLFRDWGNPQIIEVEVNENPSSGSIYMDPPDRWKQEEPRPVRKLVEDRLPDGSTWSREVLVPAPTPFIKRTPPTRWGAAKTIRVRRLDDKQAAIDDSRVQILRALLQLDGVDFQDVRRFWDAEPIGPVLDAMGEALASLDRDGAMEIFRKTVHSPEPGIVKATVAGLKAIGAPEAKALAPSSLWDSQDSSAPRNAWPANWR